MVVRFIPPLLLSWWSAGHFLLSILWHASLLLHIPANTNNDIKILCVRIKVHLHAPSPSPSKFIILPMVTDLLTDRLGSQYIMYVNVNLTATVTRGVMCTGVALGGFPIYAADAVNWYQWWKRTTLFNVQVQKRLAVNLVSCRIGPYSELVHGSIVHSCFTVPSDVNARQ